MIKIDEEYIDRVLKKYSDEDLVNEFLAFEDIMNVENICSTMLIEPLDVIYPKVMHELSIRFVSRNNKCDVVEFNIVK